MRGRGDETAWNTKEVGEGSFREEGVRSEANPELSAPSLLVGPFVMAWPRVSLWDLCPDSPSVSPSTSSPVPIISGASHSNEFSALNLRSCLSLCVGFPEAGSADSMSQQGGTAARMLLQGEAVQVGPPLPLLLEALHFRPHLRQSRVLLGKQLVSVGEIQSQGS